MSRAYDLVVIGAGSAGLAAASFAARLGARVALVERDRPGGDCTWTGCVPSKTLLHIARVARVIRCAGEAGLSAAPTAPDLRQVMEWVRAAVARVHTHETPAVLAAQGIEVITGPARFLDPRTVAVGGRRLRGRRLLICTGAAPAIPPLPGLAETPHLTYKNIFDLEALPAHLVVLGGGPIGVELAQAFGRLGAAVTVLEQASRILPAADPEASATLAVVLRAEGVTLRTGCTPERIQTSGSGIRLLLPAGEVEGDALLVATSRRPNVAGLDLERAGVAYDQRGITVDAHLRTSRRRIYAAGDVTGGFQFTHYAAWQGFYAARNALLPGAGRGTRPTVPWVVFTDPEVGQVGYTEQEARARGERVRVHCWPVEGIDRAQTTGERTGFVKLVTRPDGALLGATVVAAVAGELVNELALALEQRLTVGDLATTIHAYPTFGTGIQQAAAEAAVTRLTSGWKGPLLRALARWWP